MTRVKPRPAVGVTEAIGAAQVQPNEMDLRRILRSLELRERYRYVVPRVERALHGYRIVSPCCSRRIDPEGGEIEIAWIEYLQDNGWWRLYNRNHEQERWVVYAEFARLHELLSHLNRDPGRIFWP